MNEHQKMLDKVRHLLRLAEGAANVNESAAAAAAAQKLIEAHRLDQAMIDVRNDSPVAEETVYEDPSPLDRSKNRVLWKSILANGLARANNCQALGVRGNIVIIGTPSNIATVRYLYAYFVRQIDQMADRYTGSGRAWIHSWRVGCADAIAKRVQTSQEKTREEMLAQNEGGGSALALVHAGIARLDAEKAAVARYMANVKTKKIKTFVSRKDGYTQGQIDGHKVAINNGPGLGQGAKAHIQ